MDFKNAGLDAYWIHIWWWESGSFSCFRYYRLYVICVRLKEYEICLLLDF